MYATSPAPTLNPARDAQKRVALAVAEGAPALVDRLCGDFLHEGTADRELSALRRFTVNGLVVALLRGRFHFPIDAPVYRLCGRACARAGIEVDTMVDALDGAGEALRDELVVPAARARERNWGPERVDATVTAHCKIIDEFMREAYRQLCAAFIEEAMTQ